MLTLRDELTSHRHANAVSSPTDLVFPTSTGSRRDKNNARERVIRPVVSTPTSCSHAAGTNRFRPA
jgi:hypothetical protein